MVSHKQYLMQICITSIFSICDDVHRSISCAADSIGLREVPSYEVIMGYESDWIMETQVILLPFRFIPQY